MKNCLIFLDTKCQLKLEKGSSPADENIIPPYCAQVTLRHLGDFDYELFIQGQPRFPYEKKIRLREEEVLHAYNYSE